MASLESKLAAALKSRDILHVLRDLPPTDDDSLIDFCSNDFLSIAKRPDLRSAFLDKLQSNHNIMGTAAARIIINGSVHDKLEERLKKFFGGSDREALLFNSGFTANIAFFSTVPQSGDVIVHDEDIHTSLQEGIRGSRARAITKFSHNSAQDLERVLAHLRQEIPELQHGDSSVFVPVEALYSMDGNFAPLVELVEVVEKMFPRGNGYVDC